MKLRLCKSCTYPLQQRIITADDGTRYVVTTCSNKRCDYFYKRKYKGGKVCK